MIESTVKVRALAGFAGVLAALGGLACQEDVDPPAPFVATRTYPGPCFIHEDEITAFSVVDRTYSYDQAERVSMEEVRYPYEGWEGRHDYTYDEDGSLVRDDCTITEDGIVTSRRSTITTYEDGLVDVEVTSVLEGDAMTPVRETRYLYDTDRLLVRTETTSLETDTLTSSSDYEYDDAGRLVVQDDDNDGDGETDFRLTQEYNPEGLVEEASHTWLYGEDSDGCWVRFTYDADGSVTLEEFQYFNSDSVNLAIAYSYGSDGLLEAREHDGRLCMCPGEVDGIIDERYEYDYDAFGNLLLVTRDGHDHGAPADGATDGSAVYSYECWEP